MLGPLYEVHTNLELFCLPGELDLDILSLWNGFLSLVQLFVLKPDIIKATSVFLWLVFAWSKFFHSFAFNFRICTEKSESLLNSSLIATFFQHIEATILLSSAFHCCCWDLTMAPLKV